MDIFQTLKSLKKDIDEHINYWKKPYLLTKLKTVYMIILPKQIYRFDLIPIQISTVLYRPCKDNSLFHIKQYKPRTAKIILNIKELLKVSPLQILGSTTDYSNKTK